MMSPDWQGSWAEHLASYWAVRHEPNVLFLTYEEMRRDHPGAVARIAEFMGVALTADGLASVVHQSSFATMKALGLKFDPGQIVPWTRERSMVRSGTSGGSSDLLTPAQQKQIDDYCRADLKRLGCDFPIRRGVRCAHGESGVEIPRTDAWAGLGFARDFESFSKVLSAARRLPVVHPRNQRNEYL